MSEEKNINGFFEGWFQSFDKGLEKLDYDECGCLFSECAKGCSEYVTNNLYRGIFNECEGDLDKFFTRLHEIDNVEGKVIKPGRVYELIFKKCECPVHTEAGVRSTNLCACSKESMIMVFKNLVPDRPFKLEQLSTILDGSNICRHLISFDV